MSVRGIPAPQLYTPTVYWEDRARRFAAEGHGLAAVCSYGMPESYNRAIQLEQRLALRPWLRVAPGCRVLDVGCGVGRWSRLLAGRGAMVTGIDLSPTMIEEAERRAAHAGVAQRCRFQVQDVSDLEVGGQFDLVLAVTVLQHILDPIGLRAAVTAMARRLAPGGRIVLLEAAPDTDVRRCDSTVFKARRRAIYLDLFRACGLCVQAVTGVDPAPFRSRLLPHIRELPRWSAAALLALATGLSLPVNALLGRWAAGRSWHAVFVLETAERHPRGAAASREGGDRWHA
ncbi:MAG TPA: class I SAM-dependent methyltransferase [Steroidobacteraceae bacterium]|nr:class I SAM-dependent methyltransferase [Steroidobacteraceae bacterium]